MKLCPQPGLGPLPGLLNLEASSLNHKASKLTILTESRYLPEKNAIRPPKHKLQRNRKYSFSLAIVA